MLSDTEIGKNQLWPGDVLLEEYVADWKKKLTKFGQSIFTMGHSEGDRITHAALYMRENRILEASGSHGLGKARLEDEPAGAKFHVYRYEDKTIAEWAAAWAEHYIGKRNEGSTFGTYSKSKAGTSILHSKKFRGKKARRARAKLRAEARQMAANPDFQPEEADFYCSSWVVMMYIVAVEDTDPVPIDLDHRYVSPKGLYDYFEHDGHWATIGYVTP